MNIPPLIQYIICTALGLLWLCWFIFCIVYLLRSGARNGPKKQQTKRHHIVHMKGRDYPMPYYE